MERVIDHPQKSDMGSGYGHYEGIDGMNLGKVLDELCKTLKSWGTVTIYRGLDDVVRRFDFDLYNSKVFYHNLSGWQYNYTIRKIDYDYCFMLENINIYVN